MTCAEQFRSSRAVTVVCEMSAESLPSKPAVEAYTDEEFDVVVERARGQWRVDDPEERARELISGKKGRGPHCPECEMKPAGMKEVKRNGDYGQFKKYECLQCGATHRGVRRYMYEDDE